MGSEPRRKGSECSPHLRARRLGGGRCNRRRELKMQSSKRGGEGDAIVEAGEGVTSFQRGGIRGKDALK